MQVEFVDLYLTDDAQQVGGSARSIEHGLDEIQEKRAMETKARCDQTAFLRALDLIASDPHVARHDFIESLVVKPGVAQLGCTGTTPLPVILSPPSRSWISASLQRNS
jgi:hypothetical protein